VINRGKRKNSRRAARKRFYPRAAARLPWARRRRTFWNILRGASRGVAGRGKVLRGTVRIRERSTAAAGHRVRGYFDAWI